MEVAEISIQIYQADFEPMSLELDDEHPRLLNHLATERNLGTAVLYSDFHHSKFIYLAAYPFRDSLIYCEQSGKTARCA